MVGGGCLPCQWASMEPDQRPPLKLPQLARSVYMYQVKQNALSVTLQLTCPAPSLSDTQFFPNSPVQSSILKDPYP